MKVTVNVLLIFLLSALWNETIAQPWLQPPYLQIGEDRESPVSNNFYEIQKAFQRYEKEYKEKATAEGRVRKAEAVRFPGYNQYKRWEWFNEQRVFPSGNFPDANLVLEEYRKFLSSPSSSIKINGGSKRSVSQSWVNLSSPLAPVGNYAGMGRVNCMAFMPGNSNTIFIGAACGGVWKSKDGGLSWEVLHTDQLPSLSITSIMIDPSDTNKIYIATGDNFTGFPIAGVLKQGHFSAGIFKSTDGGLTWVLAGMPSIPSQQFIPQQMILDPSTPSTMLLAANTGIWRTVDNGTNWSQVKVGFFYGIAFNALNSNVVYATDALGLWRSDNNGLTWVYKGGGYPNISNAGRVTLAVTPADTNYIYLWGPTAGFKKSTNGGNSFSNMTNPDALAQPYGYVDRAVGVSNTNPLHVFVGGLAAVKSTDGGVTWNLAMDWQDYQLPNWVHVDIKRIVFEPGSGTKLYLLNDAGISVSTDQAATWTNISNGLQITEIYKIAGNPFNADTIYYGAQDNGTNRYNAIDTSLSLIWPGDGFQPLVDPNNSMIIFTSAQLGSIRKSIDGGVNFVSASPGQMLWNCPLKMNPLNSQTMYAGCTAGVKRSTNGGTQGTYVNLSAGVLASIIAMDVTKADTQYIYAGNRDTMTRTTDGGNSWSYITAGLPVNSAAISYIGVSTVDADRVYVCFSGYSAGNKVFMSVNGGNTWINYSGSLPNVPVNCLTYVDGSNEAVYIGTDFGVFYRDSITTDWIAFNNGLPNVVVNHLEIYYPTMKLRAGTYGRGLWETDMLTTGMLPVELLAFTGEYNEVTHSNDLQWTTASESNCHYFDVMKGGTGIPFSSIAKINCAGSVNGLYHYFHADHDPFSGINYYRLRQVDFNGESTYSQVISVNAKGWSSLMSLYPNPAATEIFIEYNGPASQTMIEIINSLGEHVTGKISFQKESAHKISINISMLPEGIYAIRWSGKGKETVAVKTFIKQ